jgi:hypothetical protein
MATATIARITHKDLVWRLVFENVMGVLSVSEASDEQAISLGVCTIKVRRGGDGREMELKASTDRRMARRARTEWHLSNP